MSLFCNSPLPSSHYPGHNFEPAIEPWVTFSASIRCLTGYCLRVQCFSFWDLAGAEWSSHCSRSLPCLRHWSHWKSEVYEIGALGCARILEKKRSFQAHCGILYHWLSYKTRCWSQTLSSLWLQVFPPHSCVCLAVSDHYSPGTVLWHMDLSSLKDLSCNLMNPGWSKVQRPPSDYMLRGSVHLQNILSAAFPWLGWHPSSTNCSQNCPLQALGKASNGLWSLDLTSGLLACFVDCASEAPDSTDCFAEKCCCLPIHSSVYQKASFALCPSAWVFMMLRMG